MIIGTTPKERHHFYIIIAINKKDYAEQEAVGGGAEKKSNAFIKSAKCVLESPTHIPFCGTYFGFPGKELQTRAA